MAWSKRDIVNEAYAEIALAGYQFDLTPDEMDFGLRRLDLFMASLLAGGYQLPYAMGLSPTDGDLDQDSGLPLIAVEAVALGLAVRIAAAKGKALASSSKQNAKAAMDALVTRLSHDELPQQVLRGGTPSGGGSRGRGYRPFSKSCAPGPLSTSPAGELVFGEG